jgi:hypothetical protein
MVLVQSLTGLWDKADLCTVPAWFGGLSLVLALYLFLRDRRRDDREQIDKVAVWPLTEYQIQLPRTDVERIEEAILKVWAKKANDLPIELSQVSVDVESAWAVDATKPSDTVPSAQLTPGGATRAGAPRTPYPLVQLSPPVLPDGMEAPDHLSGCRAVVQVSRLGS